MEAISHSGTFLDIGCANGFLLESLVAWAQEGEIHLVPFGLDCSAPLIDLARTRFPDLGSHFFAANAWDWTPPHPFDFIYTLIDCVPASHLPDYLRRLLSVAVAPGGRLIVGSYGSRSRASSAQDVGALLGEIGLPVAGSASASIDDTRLASIAWTVS